MDDDMDWADVESAVLKTFRWMDLSIRYDGKAMRWTVEHALGRWSASSLHECVAALQSAYDRTKCFRPIGGTDG